MSLLGEKQGKEVDLEEEIAELVEELLVVACERGVRDLVRLLDGVRDDRPRGLLAIPRTLAAQRRGELLELDERVRERHGGYDWPVVVPVVAGGAKPTW